MFEDKIAGLKQDFFTLMFKWLAVGAAALLVLTMVSIGAAYLYYVPEPPALTGEWSVMGACSGAAEAK
ncbi:hypothetical protein LJB99_05970 [Deltaproteobacteria bacterium OttesenSCG-928-K17]|nr:hypothetical protein [Deltaproteobacteria bacterium OttesenSCG-928-K17]